MVPILTTTSTVTCPHLGKAVLQTTNTVARIAGAPALLVTDVHAVTGCTSTPPCVAIAWAAGATQAKLGGIPLLLRTSVGICFNSFLIPQGVAVIAQTQTRGLGV
jgi:hypothetical protein